MPIKALEVGKIFRYATGFDMSSSTALSLKFTHSDGTTTFTVSNPDVTAPAVNVTDGDLGALLASEYMEFLTTALHFTISGTWTVCGTYTDATPKTFFGDDAVFIVGDTC